MRHKSRHFNEYDLLLIWLKWYHIHVQIEIYNCIYSEKNILIDNFCKEEKGSNWEENSPLQ